MKKILCLVLVVSLHFTLYTLHCLYGDVRISRLLGDVSVYQNQNWTAAKLDMVLSQQDKIKTSKGSSVELLKDGTSKIWVNENSEVEINSLGTESMFSLLVGKIRAKIKLIQGGKFTVKTPTSICAVRGTEFIATDSGELYTLDGVVSFGTGDGGGILIDIDAGYYVMIGADGNLSEPKPISVDQQNSINTDWSGFSGGTKQTGEQGGEIKENLKKELAKLRQELKEIVSNIKTDVNAARETTNEIKEADFATGRTLRDIHGNLVRVEQFLLRPDSQTLLFLNLTKRDSYIYNGKFKYDGTSDKRLDILETKITFNKNLPEQLTSWPGFIAGQEEDSFYPQKIYCQISNRNDKLEFEGVSRDKGYVDEGGNVLTDREIVMDSYITGADGNRWKIDTNYDSHDTLDTDISVDGSDNGDLWATNISPKIKIDMTGQPSRYVYLFSESYGINNDGKLLNLSDFTNTSENPFTVLKNVAIENILSVREGNIVSSTDFFARGNIDLVMTPDIVVSIAQKLATEAGNIADSIK
ncbi:MAG: FecR family protein [Elusimicrobiota bacterium]